ncbi:P-loop containing nucleoside triphosphate hydrolase protein [Microdochium trichocladiopsis]|uniref:P-loop containing nucleoside triphosphate hydrolase protein n=1 Tax=Microdochium trichocladiopsis TaxID=1682393 RepID=A0A9P8YKP8_9PEZI|nr:P-loop containing nucleoside triphosphate hydrolase protein [Microdochium trichocladiopsis]KAH7040780.1 P-loop containing nucleoside triphosphate hydrolase protein [Microdochium trichocladiopsis]
MAPSEVIDEVPSGTTTQKVTGGKVIAKVNGVNGINGHASETEKDEKDITSASDENKAEDAAEQKEEDKTMKCEIKHLDRRYDDDDEQYYEERKKEVQAPEQQDWWELYAFCIVRHFHASGDYAFTKLVVNPEPLRKLLHDLIGDYPGFNLDLDDMQISSPYHSLFHYRKEIEEEGRKRFADDEASLAQHALLIDWINKHFELDIAAYEQCVSAKVKSIAFEHLWTLFPAGKIVHAKVMNHTRAFRVKSNWYDEGEIPGLGVNVSYIDYDGERLGTRRMDLFLHKYANRHELTDLDVMPLDLDDDAENLRAELLERGRKFESLVGGQHLRQYSGLAIKKKEMGYARFDVSGRVMIDVKTFHRLEANDSFNVKELPYDKAARAYRLARKAAKENFVEGSARRFDPLSDEDACLTNSTVRGYSFAVKRFLEFYVDQLSDIEWNDNCFDQLVLDEGTKKTVQALVSSHSRDRETFDDIVKGKGQGLVCVLHGPPGVGKTLTAECVAEYVRRPLFMVSSGDLGSTSSSLDAELTKIMDMTSTWRAVLLIDEADIFLERRSLHDLHRNAMVSVFLRVLEYYSGILFLTTNRVNTFDEAFKSRIHIPIRYTDLSVESRATIWRNFCKRVPGGVDIDDKGIAKLAEHELNGRQIKNVLKAAESLAAFDGVKLDMKQLEQVTKIQAVFEKDLNSVAEIDYTAPGSSRKDADRRNMFL